nr:nucleoside monophosphate kinase [Rubrobacter sp.]
DDALNDLGIEIDKAIALEAPDDDLVTRLSGRRTSDATGKVYHEEHDPPPEDSEEDPGPFVQRKDDTEESIRNRLKIYHEQTEPLKDYYAERDLLLTVDATRSIDEVTEEILDALGETGGRA